MKNFTETINAILHNRKVKRRILSVTLILSVFTVLLVARMLMLTAISMDRRPVISADQIMMTTGGVLKAHISAETGSETAHTHYAIKTEEAGARLSDTYQFAEDVTQVTDFAGNVIELRRTRAEEGITYYTFELDQDESTEFDLFFRESAEEAEALVLAEADVDADADADALPDDGAGQTEDMPPADDAVQAEDMPPADGAGQTEEMPPADDAVQTEDRMLADGAVQTEDRMLADDAVQAEDMMLADDAGQTEEEPGMEAALQMQEESSAEPDEPRTEPASEAPEEPDVLASVTITSGYGNDVPAACESAEGEEASLTLRWVKDGLPDEEQRLSATLYENEKYETRLLEKGTVITVQGVLPVGAIARAYPVAAEAVALEEDLSKSREILCAYDISLFTADGSPWQPQGEPIEVSITSQAIETAAQDALNHKDKEILLLHVPQDGAAPDEMELTSDPLAEGQREDTIACKTDAFSPFAVVLQADVAADVIYLSGAGEDKNNGRTPDAAVKTFAKAKELLGEQAGCIVVCDTVTVSGAETWELKENQSLTRLAEEAGHEEFAKPLARVGNGGVLELKNITLDGGADAASETARTSAAIKAEGPLVTVEEGGTLTLSKGAVLKNNHNTAISGEELPDNLRGGAAAVFGQLNINGAVIEANKAAMGGGIYIGRNGSAKMTDGAIDGNEAVIIDDEPIAPPAQTVMHRSGAGGGVALAVTTSLAESDLAKDVPATFLLNGGTITHNTAYTGGGIAVGSFNFYESSFYAAHRLKVNGGTIDANTAECAGGGVFVGAGAVAEFSGASKTSLSYNRVTAGDQNAGGGMYIDGQCGIDGAAFMRDVLITDNTSSSYGGGISACASGDTNIFFESGGAIFGNNAAGNSSSNDVFIDGAGERYLVDTMLGGGKHNWTFVTVKDLMGVAAPSNAEKSAAEAAARLVIKGNSAVGADATMGRGGGIGNNGLLDIGDAMAHEFSLKKIDAVTKRTLAGAMFRLEGTSDDGVAILVDVRSGADGYARFKDIPAGTYTIKETEAPAGYEKSNRTLTLVLNDGQKLYENGRELKLTEDELGLEYSFENHSRDEEPESLRITLVKIDHAQNVLQGAVFELYRVSAATERLVSTVTTNSAGQAVFSGLTAGEYRLKEKTAPVGYLPYEESIPIILNSAGKINLSGSVTEDAVEINNNRVIVTDDSETYQLPATGGPGTTVFIMAGLTLVLAAFCLIALKRRKTG